MKSIINSRFLKNHFVYVLFQTYQCTINWLGQCIKWLRRSFIICWRQLCFLKQRSSSGHYILFKNVLCKRNLITTGTADISPKYFYLSFFFVFRKLFRLFLWGFIDVAKLYLHMSANSLEMCVKP